MPLYDLNPDTVRFGDDCKIYFLLFLILCDENKNNDEVNNKIINPNLSCLKLEVHTPITAKTVAKKLRVTCSLSRVIGLFMW